MASIGWELAHKLKEAGFPQELKHGYLAVNPNDATQFAYAMDLSELIAACGEGFRTLGKTPIGGGWYATGYSASRGNLTLDGTTHEVAVANLWIALNPQNNG